MKKKLIILIVCLLGSYISFSQNIPRVDNSCYPYSAKPDTLFLTSESLSGSQKLTIAGLQGLLAKTKPRIMRDEGIWPNELKVNYKIILNRTYYSDFKGLINRFKSQISGYILCDLDSSANVAISISNIENAIPVTSENVSVMTSLGIPMKIDVRGKNDKWTFANYGNQLSKEITVYQDYGKVTLQSDYSVFSNAWQFWGARTNAAGDTVFNRMNANGVVMGWGPDEYWTVRGLSKRNLVMNASDWSKNISTLTNIPIEKFTQKLPQDTFKIIPNVHTVCFVMSDGDNVQWLLGAANDSKQFASPNRSKVNLGWTISPSLCELAPSIYKYYYDKATNNSGGRNYFIVGPSGIGYNFPGFFSTAKFETECNKLNNYMKKTDLRIVNILDDDNSVAPISTFLKQSNVDALFYYKYSNYSGLAGLIKWYYDKPSIGGRYNLWDKTFESSYSLAKKLNALSTDIHTSNGYSLIPVHVWSMNVDSVIACVNKLNKTRVRVVAPDEFVWLIRQNIKNITLGQGDGLEGEYYNGKNFDSLAFKRVDKTIDFNWKTFSPDNKIDTNEFSVRWKGKIQPVYSETYTFYVTCNDGVRLWVNDQLIIDNWQNNTSAGLSGTIALTANQQYNIKMEYFENDSSANCKLEWGSTKQLKQVIPAAQLFSGLIPVKISNQIDKGSDLKVYPNPAANELIIEASCIKGNANIEIFNITGKLVLFSKFDRVRNSIDVSKLTSGIYIVNIKNTEVFNQQKFIKM